MSEKGGTNLLKPISGKVGYVKAAFYGDAGSGKTFTMTALAIKIHQRFNCKGPIAFFDTENGRDFVKALLDEYGIEFIGVGSRSFDDLVSVTQELPGLGVEVFIVDSMTHVWEEAKSTYLKSIQESYRAKRWREPDKLEFQHWASVKGDFTKRYTNWMQTSSVHVIQAGRMGYDYSMEENDKGRRELVQGDTKMRSIKDFGHEPNILIKMDRNEEIVRGDTIVVRKATILKDRSRQMDGKVGEFVIHNTIREDIEAVGKFFEPHVSQHTGKDAPDIDTEATTEYNINEDGYDDRKAYAIERDACLDEIAEELKAMYPGRSDKAVMAKGDLIEKHFGTRSWERVKKLKLGELATGRDALHALRTAVKEPTEEKKPKKSDISKGFKAFEKKINSILSKSQKLDMAFVLTEQGIEGLEDVKESDRDEVILWLASKSVKEGEVK